MMMMHQNRIKLGGEFDHLRPMQSARWFHPSIDDIKGCRGWLSNFCTKKQKKKVRNRSFRNGRGNPTELKPCAKVRKPYERGKADLSNAVLNAFWDGFLDIIYMITWALDRKWCKILHHSWTSRVLTCTIDYILKDGRPAMAFLRPTKLVTYD